MYQILGGEQYTSFFYLCLNIINHTKSFNSYFNPFLFTSGLLYLYFTGRLYNFVGILGKRSCSSFRPFATHILLKNYRLIVSYIHLAFPSREVNILEGRQRLYFNRDSIHLQDRLSPPFITIQPIYCQYDRLSILALCKSSKIFKYAAHGSTAQSSTDIGLIFLSMTFTFSILS